MKLKWSKSSRLLQGVALLEIWCLKVVLVPSDITLILVKVGIKIASITFHQPILTIRPYITLAKTDVTSCFIC